MMNRQHKLFGKRAFPMMIGVLLLVVMLLSSSYLAKELDHDCHGDDCPVCCFIARSEKTMRHLASGISAMIVRITMAFALFLLVLVCNFIISANTPVTNKVRLNN